MSARPVLPSARFYGVGTPEYPLSRGMAFAARYPACTFPCQRFAAAVARARA